MVLTTNQPARVRQHLTIDEVWTRYPFLASAVQNIIIGSYGEAGACIRDYIDGFDFSCEAVSHSGLTPRDRIRQAFAIRDLIRCGRGGTLRREVPESMRQRARWAAQQRAA